MSLTIRQKADAVGTFRHLAVAYMETLSRWVATTPEMEVKILFGRHIWELAQHADQLGQRTHELRAAPHYDVTPVEGYDAWVQKLAEAAGSGDRFHGFYRAALPDLDVRLGVYLDDTDTMLDEPTVRILERIRTDIARMVREYDETAAEVPAVTATDEFVSGMKAGLGAFEGFDFIAFRPTRETNMEIFS